MGRNKKNIIINNLENTMNFENIINLENTTNLENIINLNKKSSNSKTKSTESEISINEYKINEYKIIEINDFKKKEKMLYEVINIFFKNCSSEEINTIINIIEGNYKISLRFLDWFVTRYCYLYKTSINIDNTYNKEKNFNINISYKAQLKSFKKKCFDPFKRINKFYYSFGDQYLNLNSNNNLILTTLGQLNFFKWALSFDIIKYLENNFDDIYNKILYVNSFFKKNIIDNTSLSVISSDEIKSNKIKSKNSDSDNDIYIEKIPNINYKNLNIDNKLELKKVNNNYPIVYRNIFVEL